MPSVSPVIPMTIAAGFFLEGFNTTVLYTALPPMAQSLGVAPVHLSLAVSSYIVSMAVFIPVSGWIADRFGARFVYCSAVLLFTLGSVLCGLSTNLAMLVAMRILQGMGGAMMTPVGRLILIRSFPKEHLIVAMNYMAIPGQMGLLLGPAIGGFVTTYVSWHWIFFASVPFGFFAIALTLRFIKDVPAPPPPNFDLLGFGIMGLSLALAQIAMECVGRPIIPVTAQIGIFALAAAIGLLYLRHARRLAHPVLDLKLLKIRTFNISVGAGNLGRIGLSSIGFVLPLQLQIAFGLNPFQSGLLVCILAIGAVAMRAGAPQVLKAWGLPRVLRANAALLGLMIIGFGLLSPSTPIWFDAVYIFLFGFFRSIQLSSLNALGYADLVPEAMGQGTSLSSVAQRLAQSMGVAIAATLLAAVSRGHQRLNADDFFWVFLAIGLIELLSLAGLLQLKAHDGQSLTGQPKWRK